MKSDNSFKGFLKSRPGLWKIGLLLALGLMLLLFGMRGRSGTDSGAAVGDDLSVYKANLERELAELCSSVEGVGRCRVTVSFSEGTHTDYKGSSVTSVVPPRPLAVTVVCDGADSVAVRGELTGMLSALLDVGTNRVSILKLSG